MKTRAKIRWGLFLSFLLALVFHPWLLALLVRLGLAFSDAEVDGLQVHGYRQLELEGFTYAQEGFELRSGRIEIDQPWAWLQEKLGWSEGSPETVRIEEWRVMLSAPSEEETSDEPRPRASAKELKDTLDQLWMRLNWWIPRLVAVDGTIAWQDEELRVPELEWHDRRLSFEVDTEVFGRPLHGSFVTTAFSRGELVLDLNEETVLQATFRLRERRDYVNAFLEGNLLGNPFTLDAHLVELTQIPEMKLLMPELQLAGERVAAPWLDVASGGLEAVFEEGEWNASVHVAGTFETPDLTERFRLVASANGRADAVTLSRLEVDSPLLEADLSSPIALDWSSGAVEIPESFALVVDLSPLQAWDIDGLLQLRLHQQGTGAGMGRFDRVGIELTADELSLQEFFVNSLRMDAVLAWPWLEVSQFAVELEGARVEGSGRLQIPERRLDAVALQAGAAGAWVAELVDLPEDVQFTEVKVDAKLNGPLSLVESTGQLNVREVHLPRLRVFDAEGEWSATGWQDSEHQLRLAFEDAQLSSAITVHAERDRVEATVRDTDLRWSEPDHRLLQDGAAGVTTSWSPEGIQHLEVVGVQFWEEPRTDAAVVEGSVLWRRGQEAEAVVSVNQLDGALAAAFVSEDIPEVAVRRARLELAEIAAGSSAHSLRADLVVDGNFSVPGQGAVALRGQARAADGRLVVSETEMAINDHDVVSMNASVPVTFSVVDPKSLWSLDRDADMRVEVTSLSPREIAGLVKERGGATVEAPRLRVTLSGTPAEPRMTGDFSAASLRVPEQLARQELLFREIDGQIRLRETALELQSLSFFFEDRPVQVSAVLPFEQGLDLTKLINNEFPELAYKQVSGEASIGELPVAVIARFIPGYLGRSGTVSAELSKESGRPVAGRLVVENLQTRALPNGTFLHDVNADLRVADRRFEIEHFEGKLSQRPVAISGYIDFGDLEEPRFELSVQGENLPLVRNTDLLLRSDVDLRLTRLNTEPAQVSGRVQLRDSFFSQGAFALLTPKVQSAQSRPPFFSVEQEPFADWRLNVDVRGDRFFRIDTQVFKGLASADFKLGGTLEEPTLVGRAIVDEGRITLAFGTLRVLSGEAWTTVADPYTIQIDVETEGRSYGYDIDGSITGTLQTPVPNLNSSPPLDPDQIILLLTAGVIPEQDRVGHVQRSQALALYFGETLLSRLFPGAGAGGLAERVEFEYGQEISEKGRETYAVEYEISEDVSARGEYSKYDEYVFTLKYEIFSR